MAAVKLQVYKLFEKTYGEENAKIIMTFIEENNEKRINDLKSIFLTKEDKIEIINLINVKCSNLENKIDNRYTNLENKVDSRCTDLENKQSSLTDRINELNINLTRRLDSHFKWLVGIMIAIAGLCLTLAKLIH